MTRISLVCVSKLIMMGLHVLRVHYLAEIKHSKVFRDGKTVTLSKT